MTTAACEYLRARTVEEALEALQRDEAAKIIAGGVALVGLMNQRLFSPTALVDITRLSDLGGIRREDDGTLRLGALVTHGEIERSALLAGRCPLLVEMAREIACGRIRNRGTLGGNLCHADPQEDPPAALLALGARLVIRGAAGRREVHARDFFRDSFVTAVGDGELLEEVWVPEPAAGAGMAYGKFGPRRAMDYTSTISAAVVLRRDGQGRIVEAGIGMSGVGPTSVRPARASASLLGQRATPDVLAAMVSALGEEIDPAGDFEFSADYKRHLAGVLLRRTVQQAYDRAATGKGA